MMPFHYEILPEGTWSVFSSLAALPDIQQFYLAGGTALAFHLGHRYSVDLDFFAEQHFDESGLIKRLAALGEFQLEKKDEQSIIGVLRDTKLSFLGYSYPLLAPLTTVERVFCAGIIDLACMKLDALASRGTKRDFVDIYFIAQETMPLSKILASFEKKYASLHYNMMHIKKSLVYFEDAEEEPMPRMLKPVDWKTVKEFFKKEAATLH